MWLFALLNGTAIGSRQSAVGPAGATSPGVVSPNAAGPGALSTADLPKPDCRTGGSICLILCKF